jgi:hypothetical protein
MCALLSFVNALSVANTCFISSTESEIYYIVTIICRQRTQSDDSSSYDTYIILCVHDIYFIRTFIWLVHYSIILGAHYHYLVCALYNLVCTF